MALVFVRGIGGIGGNETSQSSTVMTVGSNDVAAANLAIIFIGGDNRSTADGVTNDITGVTDSKGNTWTKIGEFTNTVGGAAADGAVVAAFYSIISSALVAGTDTITVSYSGAIVAKGIAAVEYTKTAGTTISVGGTVQTLANDNLDAGSMSLSSLTSREYLFLRAIASETDNAAIATSTTSYNNGSNTSGSGGSEKGHNGVAYERRVLTGTGDSSDPTMSDITADRASIYFALYEVTSTPSFIGGVGMMFFGVGSLSA